MLKIKKDQEDEVATLWANYLDDDSIHLARAAVMKYITEEELPEDTVLALVTMMAVGIAWEQHRSASDCTEKGERYGAENT